MKKIFFAILLMLLLFAQLVAVAAITSSEAKQAWYDSKAVTKTAKDAHREAKVTRAADPTPENKQAVVDTGKVLLNSALDEVDAWLVWKDAEADENPEIPADLKQQIKDDVAENRAKISGLKDEVDAVDNELGLALVFLKLIGEYIELLADVARNTGNVWAHILTVRADTTEAFEQELRTAAEGISDNDAIIAKLDLARSDIESARTNISNAETEYDQVVIPGTPLVKFANGNSYLRIARGDLITAHGYLNQAYILLAQAGGSSE